MILGRVSDILEPLARIEVLGVNGIRLAVEALIDTGFSGFISLPPDMIAALGVQPFSVAELVLANSDECDVPVYEAVVSWGGQARPTPIYALEGGPLIGMALLRDHLLAIEATEGGSVQIRALSANDPD